MTGRVTYRNGPHPSRKGGWLELPAFGNGEWREIENAIGALSSLEREAIEEHCAQLRGIANDKLVPADDVRVTLRAMAGEPSDAGVIRAFAHCDSRSESALHYALYRLDGPMFFTVLPSLAAKHQAAKLRAAAWKAAQDFKPGRGPSIQGWQRNTAEYATFLAKWRGLPTSAHGFDDDAEPASPVVRLLLTLLGIVRPTDSPQSVSWCVKLLGEINARAA